MMREEGFGDPYSGSFSTITPNYKQKLLAIQMIVSMLNTNMQSLKVCPFGEKGTLEEAVSQTLSLWHPSSTSPLPVSALPNTFSHLISSHTTLMNSTISHDSLVLLHFKMVDLKSSFQFLP